MIKTKVAFLVGQPFSSQPELFDNFSDCSDWPDKKPALQKSHFCFDHVNRPAIFHLGAKQSTHSGGPA